ncbi:histidine phosphatase family protein [Shewanella sairae]|nr:histidine phosphatase family protein [Shewanella sairae]MCL1128356.1 histidine phosphatase family protein [Shewanella sairae]
MKTLVVIRHAEKHQDGSKDPKLSALGEQRAQALIKALSGLPVSQLIASNYQRTQLTLAPLAEHLQLPIIIATTESGIDSHIAQIVALVNQSKGNAVIAAHSNTVPLIIESFGGPRNIKIEEEEYGGLYQLVICKDDKTNLLKTHFGEPSAQKKRDM